MDQHLQRAQTQRKSNVSTERHRVIARSHRVYALQGLHLIVFLTPATCADSISKMGIGIRLLPVPGAREVPCVSRLWGATPEFCNDRRQAFCCVRWKKNVKQSYTDTLIDPELAVRR
jgi:hypothetical protein